MNLASDRLIRKIPFKVGPYTFESVLGRGAFSTVFKVKHEFSNKYYAAKAVQFQDCSVGQINVLKAETDALKSLYHPNIIKIYDVLQEYSHFFMIIELCSGESVMNLVDSHPKGLATNQLLSIMRQTLSAIAFCHSHKISHRDIKPANILIDESGRCILSDFGLSCNVMRRDKVSEFCGSLPYKPPEIVRKISYSPLKADIWSLGITFYVLAVGHLPWSNNSACAMEDLIVKARYKIPSRVAQPVADIISSMIKVDPKDRPSASELLANELFTKTESCLVPVPPRMTGLPPNKRRSFLSLTNNMLPGRNKSRSQIIKKRSSMLTFTFKLCADDEETNGLRKTPRNPPPLKSE